MDQLVNPAQCCPECGSKEYVFRGRKKVPAEAGQLRGAWLGDWATPGLRPEGLCDQRGREQSARSIVNWGGAYWHDLLHPRQDKPLNQDRVC